MSNEPIIFDTPQDWPCFVCGKYAGTSREVIHLCKNPACARAMGIVETSWELAPKKEVEDV